MDKFLKKYKLNLTEQQKKAVEAVNGPTLLLAVPGSGKTTTLVARLGYMIYEKRIPPENILVLTYTIAATKDMSERFTKVFGNGYQYNLEFRTINGVCSKIIGYYAKKVGKQAFPLETDEKKKNARIAKIYQNIMNEYPTEGEIRDVSTEITYIKNMMLTKEEIKKYSERSDYELEEIYDAYNKSMQQDGLMDYDDQMRYAYNILRSSPETLNHFQDTYKYICVDEAQDTSKIQHVIIALLASKYENLFMVGDEDQSIYGFRAAYPEALLEFEKVHKDAQILVMEENFRSNAKIVKAADRLIKKNYFRHKKNMVPHRDEGEDIMLEMLNSRAEQYDFLAKKLAETKIETAVLYKNNESVLPLVDRLERQYTPYRIKNAELMFFTNRIVTDILDILRFSQDPYNTEIFMKLYYKMNIYITKDEAYRICEKSRNNNISILIAGKGTRFETKQKNDRFREFAEDISDISRSSPEIAILSIVSASGYGEYLRKNRIRENKSFILREIAKHCKDVNDFLKRLEYLQYVIRNNDNKDSNIILSTIHSSKGLEYDTVYMLDIIDGIIPEDSLKKDFTKEEMMAFEEERRVYYVGITRAKERLILLDTNMPSTFINETLRCFTSSVDPKSIFGKQKKQKSQEKPKISYTDFCNTLKTGINVNHKVLGQGIITGVNIPYITIRFMDKERTLSIKMLHEKNLLEIIP